MKAEVRAYEHRDAPELVRIHNEIYQDGLVLSSRFRRRMVALQKSGGRIWTVAVDKRPMGYASIRPVPGLDGIYDIQGCIDPRHQREGLASQLLIHLLGDLKGSQVRQVSHPVHNTSEPAARFLRYHGFFVEHEELFLTMNIEESFPAPALPAGYTLKNFSRTDAVSHFRDLYDMIFSGYPWYQPYSSDSQVSAELVDSTDILFLLHQGKPIGFLWMRWPELQQAEIEPLGILPAYRGQGLGRSLLLAALEQLAERGISQVSVGAWQDNKAAIRFYKRLGFLQDQTLVYLAYNLNYR